jgi:hypothetical protein
MAVMVICNNPQNLLSNIKTAIQNGTIETWIVDKDGDLSHSPPQWLFQAWFRPSPEQGKLVFYILGAKAKAMTKTIYGVYHGRLIESLLTHFDLEFSYAYATALPTGKDWVKPPGLPPPPSR